jgi:hypothetical protein
LRWKNFGKGKKMARIRYLKPEFFKDDDLAKLPFVTRLFFAGLWNHADKAGRLEDRPARLKAEIFPYDEVDVEECLIALAKQKSNTVRPFIVRYEQGGEKYIQIVNWDKHQRPHHTEKDSEIPPHTPPKDLTTKIKIKGSVHDASVKLDNSYLTVKDEIERYFERFWKLYPRKVKRSKAFEAWVKIGSNPGSLGKMTIIIKALEKQIQHYGEEWQRENQRYCPHPTSWINQGRWEDVLSPSPDKTGLKQRADGTWYKPVVPKSWQEEEEERLRDTYNDLSEKSANRT